MPHSDQPSRQEQALHAVRAVLEPLITLLLRQGVGFPAFSAEAKRIFLSMALAEIQRQDQKETDSAISLLSGVHRKDVSAWRSEDKELPQPKPSLASEVFTRWLTDATWLDEDGFPRELPRELLRQGSDNPAERPSFDQLARSVNQDVHPLSVLNELVRLGMAQILPGESGDTVRLCADSYVPKADHQQMLALFANNLAAHARTAVHNLDGQEPAQLEQAAWAGGLSDESAQQLAELSRQLWAQMLNDFVAQARVLHERDQGQGPWLVRLGAYFNPTLDDTP